MQQKQFINDTGPFDSGKKQDATPKVLQKARRDPEGIIAAVLFSTQRFRQLVQYQQKVWHIRQEVLADMKNSSAC